MDVSPSCLNSSLPYFMQYITCIFSYEKKSIFSTNFYHNFIYSQAIMVDEKDVWDPDTEVVSAAHKMCIEIVRNLKPKEGKYIQISFAQPHFRTKYLMGVHAAKREHSYYEPMVGHSDVYGWELGFHKIITNKNGFDNFLYVATMR